jgi:hypothetical protein
MTLPRACLLAVALAVVLSACGGQPVVTSPTPVATSEVSRTQRSTAGPVPTPSLALPSWITQQQRAMTNAAVSDLVSLDRLTRYEIDLGIDLDSLTLSGTQQTRYTNNEDVPLEELYFNLFPNSARFAAAMDIGSCSAGEQQLAVDYERGGAVAKVALPDPLLPGEVTAVTLSFSARVPAVQDNEYLVFAYAGGVLSLGDWHPMVAVYDDDDWNLEYPEGTVGEIVYSESAFYAVRLTLPSGPVVVATGVEAERTLNADGSQTLVYYSGPVRDFHIVVSDRYEVATGMVGETKISSYYWPEHEMCGAQAIWFASLALNLYNQVYGPYPFTELDLAEADLWPWAIEWPAMILVGDPLYSDPEEECGEWHIVHEVAHQWWYSVVGNDQVDQPWLDEALANYSTVLYYQVVHDPETARAAISKHIDDRYRDYADAYGDGVVGGPTSSYSTASYYPLVYAKGALFFEALRELMGDETFFQGLQSYYKEFKYGVATPEGLLTVMERVYGEPLDEFYEHWVLKAEGL